MSVQIWINSVAKREQWIKLKDICIFVCVEETCGEFHGLN